MNNLKNKRVNVSKMIGIFMVLLLIVALMLPAAGFGGEEPSAVPDVSNAGETDQTIESDQNGNETVTVEENSDSTAIQTPAASSDLLTANDVYVDKVHDLMNVLQNGLATHIELAPGDYRFSAGTIPPANDYLWLYGYPCVSRDLMIVCKNGTANIFCEKGRRHLFLTGDNQTLTFAGVTLNGGGIGGGIAYVGHDVLTLNGAHIVSCVANDQSRGYLWGGAVNAAIGAVDMSDCTFENNQARHGGAIFTENGGHLKACKFIGNLAVDPENKEDGYGFGYGGAIAMNGGGRPGGPVIIENGYFENNYADEMGGAIGNNYTKPESLTVKDSTFVANRAGSSGGAIGFGAAGGNSLIENCTFTGNLAKQDATAWAGYGGAIYSLAGNIKIRNVTISGSRGANGGAIATATNSGNLSIEISTIAGNTVEARGGGIYTSNVGTVTITDTLIENNAAGSDGGGMALLNKGDTTIKDTDLIENSATKAANGAGGAIYSGVYTRDDNVVMQGGSMTDNSAMLGGGWFAYDDRPTLEGVTVTSNTAKNGGALYTFLADMAVSNSNVAGNNATLGGGAFVSSYITYGAKFTMSNSAFENNTATKGGGVFVNDNAFSTLSIPAGKTASFCGNVSEQTSYPDVSKPTVNFEGNVTKITPKFSGDRLAPGLNKLVFNNDDINLQYVMANVWKVNYHAGDGEGSMDVSYVLAGDPFTLAENAFTKEHHDFIGWNSSADGTGTDYENRHKFDQYDLNSDLDLYAQWKEIAKVIPLPPISTIYTSVPTTPSVSPPLSLVKIVAKTVISTPPADQSEPQVEIIHSKYVPGKSAFIDNGTWSVISMFAGIISALIAIGVTIFAILTRRQDAGCVEKRRHTKWLLMSLVIVFGVATPMLFLALNDMSHKAVWINEYTSIICFSLLIVIISAWRFIEGQLRTQSNANQ